MIAVVAAEAVTAAPEVEEMPGSWLDTLLLGGLAILIAGFAFVSAVEGWRRVSRFSLPGAEIAQFNALS
jgi:hypothetical protein